MSPAGIPGRSDLLCTAVTLAWLHFCHLTPPARLALSPAPPAQLKPWKLEKDGETQLLDLLPFLEAVVRTGVPDVRDVVRSYDGQDIPAAFR